MRSQGSVDWVRPTLSAITPSCHQAQVCPALEAVWPRGLHRGAGGGGDTQPSPGAAGHPQQNRVPSGDLRVCPVSQTPEHPTATSAAKWLSAGMKWFMF